MFKPFSSFGTELNAEASAGDWSQSEQRTFPSEATSPISVVIFQAKRALSELAELDLNVEANRRDVTVILGELREEFPYLLDMGVPNGSFEPNLTPYSLQRAVGGPMVAEAIEMPPVNLSNAG